MTVRYAGTVNRLGEGTFQNGTVVGRYRVVEQIGAGGMGDVYRARDLDLDRDVALKVLPSDLVGNEDRVRRFVQEAKAASGLNHPNIITIYEIGHTTLSSGAEIHFIAMEFIDGETLRAKIQKPRRDVKSLLRFAAQAADALAKAHAAGIIHRDLKPDNVMVTKDGYTKVLDFGLAKLTENREQTDKTQTATELRPQTREGLIMGTIGYMSPEQAEGKSVDSRSDIFSFGCILYEIATGQRPFTGRSEVDVLHAIIHNDPPPITEVNPSAPAELRRIVRRCLAKDPDERFQSMRDLANTLRDLVDEFDQLAPASGSTTMSAASGDPRNARRLPWVIATVALASTLCLAAWVVLRRGKVDGGAASAKPLLSITALTANGTSSGGSLSPDGKFVAYVVAHRLQTGVRVRQVATGAEFDLFPLSDMQYATPTYSPDGDYIYVRGASVGSSSFNLMAVPAVGGPPREILNNVNSRIAFSPDGKRIAFLRTVTPESQVCVANADGGDVRVIARRETDEPFTGLVAWSPNGEWIAVGARGNTGGLHVVPTLLSPDGKQTKRLGEDRWFWISDGEWLPDMSGIVIAGQNVEGRNQIWLLSYPAGDITRVTTDLHAYFTVSVARDGQSVVVTQGEAHGAVWKAGLDDGVTAPVTRDRLRHWPAPTMAVDNSGRIYYPALDAGTPDIWAIEPDGVTRRQITRMPGAEFGPVLSADQKEIFFQHETPAGFELHAVSSSGSNRRLVTRLPPINGLSIPHPSGRMVVVSASAQRLAVPIDGGPIRNLPYPVSSPHISFSPDGKRVAGFFRLSPDPSVRAVPAILNAEDGKPVTVFERRPSQLAKATEWTNDGRYLAFVDDEGGTENLWLQPVGGGPPRKLTQFDDDSFIVSVADGPGNTLFFCRLTTMNDLVVMRNFR